MPIPYIIHVSKHGSIRWVSQSLLDLLNVSPGVLREKQIEDAQGILPSIYHRTILRILRQISENEDSEMARWSEGEGTQKMLVRWLRSGDDIEVHFFPQTGMIRRQRILERYVSPEILRMSENRLDQLRLPERRVLTVSFTDLRGFTALSESLEPEESRDLLNTYLECVMARVWDFDGWIDKLIGDEVMALYGAESFTQNHAFNAIRSACSQIAEMARIQNRFKVEGRPMLPCGIGVHSGNMMIGNIGSSEYQEFTVIGAAVNLTSRIANVAGPGQVLVTEETLDAFLEALPEDWECREIHRRSGSGHRLESKRRQFVDELLPLSPEQDGKVIAVGPNVIAEQERAVFHFVYRCRVVVKGIMRPIPVIEVKQLQADPLGEEGYHENTHNENSDTDHLRILGKYKLLHRIDDTQEGKVWKARDSFGHLASIKLFDIPSTEREIHSENFEEHTKCLPGLRHSNITKVLETGMTDGLFYVVSDFHENMGAAREILEPKFIPSTRASRNTPFVGKIASSRLNTTKWTHSLFQNPSSLRTKSDKSPQNLCIQNIIRLCDALEHGYSSGFLRPTLQWDDIIVDPIRGWTLSSFRWTPASIKNTKTNILLSERHVNSDTSQGICLFTPPEISKTSDSSLAVSHIYSLGVLLKWCIIALEYTQDSESSLFQDIPKIENPVRSEKSRQLHHFSQKEPRNRDLAAIIRKAMEVDPHERYESPEKLKEDLELFLNGREISARRHTWAYRAERAYARNKRITHIGMLGIFLISMLSYQGLKTIGKFERNWTSTFNYSSSSENASPIIINHGMPYLLNTSIYDAFRAEIDFEFLGGVGGARIQLVPREKPNHPILPALSVSISNTPSTLQVIELHSPGLPFLYSERYTATAPILAEGVNKILIEYKSDGVSLFVNGEKTISDSNPILYSTDGHQLALSSFGDARIKIQGINVSNKNLPTYSDPIQAAEYAARDKNALFLAQKLISLLKEDAYLEWHDDAFYNLQHLELNHSLGLHQNIVSLSRKISPSGDLTLDYQRAIEENDVYKDWIQGNYSKALSQLPKIFQKRSDTQLAAALAKAMPRPASIAEGQRLVYWLGQTKDLRHLEFSQPIGPVSLEPLAEHALESLRIRNSQIDDITVLKGMPIRTLDLSGNAITGLDALHNMPLVELNLSNNALTSIDGLDAIQYVPYLQLDLSGNPVQSLAGLNGMAIYSLNLSDTLVTNIAPLETIKYLKSLKINRTPVETVSFSQDLETLKYLELDDTPLSDFEFLKRTPALNFLSLNSTEITKLDPLSHLNLEELDLSFTPIRNLENMNTHSLKSLRTLGVAFDSSSLPTQHAGLDWEFLAIWRNPDEADRVFRRLELSKRKEWDEQLKVLHTLHHPSSGESSTLVLPNALDFSELRAILDQFGKSLSTIRNEAQLKDMSDLSISKNRKIWARLSDTLIAKHIQSNVLEKAISIQDKVAVEDIFWLIGPRGTIEFDRSVEALPWLELNAKVESDTIEPTSLSQL